MKSPILKYATLNALGTTLYIALVASCLFYSPKGTTERATVLIPIAMLLLFVFSAAFTATLVLGRPILWYLDGKKKEAITLLMATLGVLFVIMLIAFSILVALAKT